MSNPWVSQRIPGTLVEVSGTLATVQVPPQLSESGTITAPVSTVWAANPAPVEAAAGQIPPWTVIDVMLGALYQPAVLASTPTSRGDANQYVEVYDLGECG